MYTRVSFHRRTFCAAALLLWATPSGFAAPSPSAALAPAGPALQDEDAELAELSRAERREADLLRRRGDLRGARRRLSELLDDDPNDIESRCLRARVRFDSSDYERALDDARKAYDTARETGAARELAAQCARQLAEILGTLGRYREALEVLSPEGVLAPSMDARDAWALGRALLGTGDKAGAMRVFELGVDTSKEQSWQALVDKSRCERAVGRLERASTTLVEADKIASAENGVEPDILAALAGLYFESEREVEAPGKRPAGALYKEALEIHPGHAPSLLGLFELGRYNRRRSNRAPEEYLTDLFDVQPDSVDGLIAAASADLEDGQLKGMRERLARLTELAPQHRAVRTLQAALAWVEHREDDCEAILAELLAVFPEDSVPEREVGRHLLELYRFAEGRPFLERAVARNPTDYEAWTQLGRSLANIGDEAAARVALEKADKAAARRQDAWRNNLRIVLRRMDEELKIEDFGELSFAWKPDAADVFRTYLLPFYREARADFIERYGYTPRPVKIELFRRHRDFSVRSVGFEGFPALGVCFGPVFTALSPLSEMRGNFSWARTAFHEFSHVIHLGLSHNRCPRWITEGLATWEETNRNPTWTRNMRRELIDAHANEDLIKVRDLNRAFRGPRILFGYYQGGLLCEMLIERHGFPPMIELLEAFDAGLDLDQAFEKVFATTPEAVDEAFAAFVTEKTRALMIEPRWSTSRLSRLRVTLAREAPSAADEREAWGQNLCTLAWGSWQQGRKVDAQEALRRLALAELKPARARFLRGEIALSEGRRTEARDLWRAVVDDGGRDFRALVGLGTLLAENGDTADAESAFLLAEEAFPGYDSPSLSAELKLVELYVENGDEDAAHRARERWLAWNPGELAMRRQVAAWHGAAGRWSQASHLLEQANEIDPFLRDLHIDWGKALHELGKHAEALREFRVALIVPPELDGDYAGIGAEEQGGILDGLFGGSDSTGPHALSDDEKAELHARAAVCLKELGRDDESKEEASRALELDDDCELARDLW